MARDVNIRTSYSADSVFMSRLKRAIELDPKMTEQWKQEAISHVDALTVLFIQADNQIGKLRRAGQLADPSES